MKGENSRETGGVARVFLRKNTRKRAPDFAVNALGFPPGVITARENEFKTSIPGAAAADRAQFRALHGWLIERSPEPRMVTGAKGCILKSCSSCRSERARVNP